MRRKDTSDVIASAVAVAADAAAIFGGFMLATWLRFDSGWIPLLHERPPLHLYAMYGYGAAGATLVFLFIFRALKLYVRPQVGVFSDKIPRLVRGTALGILFATALAFAVRIQNVPPFSRVTVALSFLAILVLLLVERYLLFRWEIHVSRHSVSTNKALVLGADEIAAHLLRGLSRDPRLRTEVVGFVLTDEAPPDPGVPADRIRGGIAALEQIVQRFTPDQIILTHSRLGHARIVEIMLLCEKNLITFNMVPDLFRIMLGDMNVQLIDDIPLLGVSPWPLDYFWNRALKRTEDIAGALAGLLLAAPILALAAIAIKRTSRGPVFYRQARCGENGKPFTLYKLRTMQVDAEAATGPVWARENDPRRTPLGTFLRRFNLDELPQFWNVLKGEMSLVGPRPERPAFVEQFKEGINRYMWRHVFKPGMTGWAQVNGLRGNTSLDERIRYDLYYFENWSLAFDFKILIKTFFVTQNAY
jgi:exopolysaccharide biosynthesis polyprenyl glycosylphosphotransferase